MNSNPHVGINLLFHIINLSYQRVFVDQIKLIYKSGIIVYRMIRFSLPTVMKDIILHDAMERDITTARRFALLETLWNERYLTRSQPLPG